MSNAKALQPLTFYREYLQDTLSTKRYQHSLAVEKQAVLLAQHWGADPEKAAYAGLLHDVARELPLEKQLQYLTGHGILLDKHILSVPGVWHGPVGALILEHELGISDKEILRAVWYHVLGAAPMTPLEEVVYIADYTSEDRRFPHAQAMRKLVMEKPSAVIYEIIREALKRQLNKGMTIIPYNIQVYNFYAEQAKKTKQANHTKDNPLQKEEF